MLAQTDVSTEYEALHRQAIVLDRSRRGRMRFTGAKAAEVLTGLVTSDAAALEAGRGQYGAALTAKGRIIADLRIFALADSFLVDVPARAWDGWVALVKKFVNPRLAKYQDESGALRDIGVFGASARHVVAAI